MSEDELRNYLNRQSTPDAGQPKVPLRRATRQAARAREREQAQAYQDFSATHLYCPRCRQAMPVRERILLYLSDGDLYDYSCVQCGTSLGTRKAGK